MILIGFHQSGKSTDQDSGYEYRAECKQQNVYPAPAHELGIVFD